jgi:hypothetical protein
LRPTGHRQPQQRRERGTISVSLRLVHSSSPSADQQDGIAHRHGEAVADHRLQQGGVVGEARDHLSGARAFEVAGRKAQDVIEHRAPDVGDDAFAGAHHQVEAGEGGRREQQRQCQHRA